jgi:hypothetical protein
LGKLPSQFLPVDGDPISMNLDLSDEESAALTKELNGITRNDRYPFSERIRTLKAILAKLTPEPVREPLQTAGDYRTAGKRRSRLEQLESGLFVAQASSLLSR